mgnify:CR=1 FL=1
MRSSIFPTEDNLHEVGILYLLIFLIVVHSDRELVRPRFVGYIHLSDDSLIVIAIMEALEPLFLFGEDSRIEVKELGENLVAVIRIVLVSVELYGNIVCKGCSGVEATLVGIEGTISVGKIGIIGIASFGFEYSTCFPL